MLKKTTTVLLLGFIVWGMTYPIMAAHRPHQRCEMKCCEAARDMSTPGAHNARENHLVKSECPDGSPCEINSIPSSVIPMVEIVWTKHQPRIELLFSVLDFHSVSSVTIPQFSDFLTRHDVIRTSRDILTSQSLLII